MTLLEAARLAQSLDRRITVHLIQDPGRVLSPRQSAVLSVAPLSGRHVHCQVGSIPTWQRITLRDAERVQVQ